MNVGLDAIAGDNGEDSRRQKEERSRSTWAQVVSSGDVEETEAEGVGGSGAAETSGARDFVLVEKEENGGGNDGDWETVVGRRQHPQHDPQKRPQKKFLNFVIRHNSSPLGFIRITYKKHPDEQEYMADTEHAANVEPTREEPHDLS
ncbi:uncharacterized protein LOC141829785 [Curcuma longa]|uniref:uncharacterized protein LOC141829785 n=1 Tax=Curcuma longa TaxID=136217 RepID=UPI003D9FA2EF